MDLTLLVFDSAAQECRLKVPPPEPTVGRPNKLTVEQVRRGRYLYWTGRMSGNRIAREWGIHRAQASPILNFKRLTWM